MWIAYLVGMKHKHLISIIILTVVTTTLLYGKTHTKDRDIAAIERNQRLSPYVIKTPTLRSFTNKKTLVAVIDTGIDYNHPALKSKIWINKKEDLNGDGKCTKADFDGIDQDKNGHVDDCRGWNFAADNNDPMDNHGHGTHIAGIIAAIVNTAPNRNISILPLKYYDPKITKNHIQSTVNAIKYAVKMGVHVINYSAGGEAPSKAEKIAILKAKKKGILFVAAAGNEKNNVEKVPYYPSSYKLSNIISVAATNKRGSLLSKSNWGNSIDIAAPGFNVLSTLPNNKYGNMSGTSMAASFVTGLISILIAEGNMSAIQAAEHVRSSASFSTKLYAKISNNRQINPTKALRKTKNEIDVQRKIAKIFKNASAL
jgi:subtilisin family serine protease